MNGRVSQLGERKSIFSVCWQLTLLLTNGGGTFLLHPHGQQEFGDYWKSRDSRPIHIKEAQAVVNSLSALKETISDHRVGVFCDNLAVVKAWSSQGARDPALNAVLKDLFILTFDRNVNLHMQYIQSGSNPADKESRRLSGKDATLVKEKWVVVEDAFGPHTVDLMAVESNAMLDSNQNRLKYYSPFPMASVVPALYPAPMWWPLLWSLVVKWVVLAKRGDKEALLYPSKHGSKGLECDLIVARLRF